MHLWQKILFITHQIAWYQIIQILKTSFLAINLRTFCESSAWNLDDNLVQKDTGWTEEQNQVRASHPY